MLKSKGKIVSGNYHVYSFTHWPWYPALPPEDQASSESESGDIALGHSSSNPKGPTRSQPAIKINDIKAGTLTFYDRDVDITMDKDLERRGLQPHGVIEDFWSKDQTQPKSQSSQFQGMFPDT
jgi:hypothetical protein